MWKLIHLPTSQVIYTNVNAIDVYSFLDSYAFAMVDASRYERIPDRRIVKCDKFLVQDWIANLKWNEYNPVELNKCEFEVIECGK